MGIGSVPFSVYSDASVVINTVKVHHLLGDTYPVVVCIKHPLSNMDQPSALGGAHVSVGVIGFVLYKSTSVEVATTSKNTDSQRPPASLPTQVDSVCQRVVAVESALAQATAQCQRSTAREQSLREQLVDMRECMERMEQTKDGEVCLGCVCVCVFIG